MICRNSSAVPTSTKSSPTRARQRLEQAVGEHRHAMPASEQGCADAEEGVNVAVAADGCEEDVHEAQLERFSRLSSVIACARNGE